LKSSPREPSDDGRPPEIEEIANRLWIHPASRALVTRLMSTPVTPNQISLISILAAAVACASFVWLPTIPGALLGLAWLFAWHVLDGADGDLARRTGRASASGELIDGVCDHVSQGLIYIALAAVLQRTVGFWAWPLALAAAASHTVQANAYESGRKTYRHWVYGAAWMRQRPDLSRSWAGLANRAYLGAANAFSPGEGEVETAMARAGALGETSFATARRIYRTAQAPLVKRSGLLGSTGRSLAVVASLVAGSPIWFFLYEIVVLDIALLVFVLWRRRANLEVARALSGLGAEL
jgi:phosphatidylglycerophosphate synthase